MPIFRKYIILHFYLLIKPFLKPRRGFILVAIVRVVLSEPHRGSINFLIGFVNKNNSFCTTPIGVSGILIICFFYQYTTPNGVLANYLYEIFFFFFSPSKKDLA